MRKFGSTLLAGLVSTVLGAGAASAGCQTSDLAGEWFATYALGAPGYCTLTVDATGAVTASACWVEKLKADPQFVLTGALAADDACKVTGTFTAAPSSANKQTFLHDAKAAKAELKSKGKGGHGNKGDKSLALSGRLLTGAELVNGLLTRTNGQFAPVSLTRSN